MTTRMYVALGVVTAFGAAVIANPPGQLVVANSGAAWADPQQLQGQQIDPKDIQEIKQDVKAIKKLLEELAKEGTEAVTPPAADPKGTEALTSGLTTCVQCHNERDAPKKGDRFILFRYQKQDGKDVPALREDMLSREWKAVRREVKDGKMPKSTPTAKLSLNPDQSRAIIAEAEARIAELDK